MKLFARTNSFFDAIAFVVYVNYAVGLRVFEYPRGHPRSVLSFIYLLIVYIIFCGGVFCMTVYFKNVSLLKLDYILYHITGSIYFLTVIVKMITGWWYSKQINVCYKKIFEIDKTLRHLGLEVNYDSIYYMIIGFIIIWFIVTIFFGISSVIYFKSRTDIFTVIYMIVVADISMTIDYINAFEFYVLLRCLQTKFKLINHLLRETIRNLSMQKTKLGTFELKDYIKLVDFEQQKNIFSIKMISQWSQSIRSASNFVLEKQSFFTSQIKTRIPFPLKKKLENKYQNQSHQNISIIKNKNHVHLLQITKQVHLELCKVSKLICAGFGIQINWDIGIVIITIIQTLYNIYNRFIISILKFTVADTFMSVTVCLLNLIKIIFLSRACKNAADEGNKTAELIHITYGSNTDIDSQEEMQQFSIQIIQSPVTFYIYGLTMDNQVLNMILKSITTYMVITIQVSSSLESNSAIPDIHF